MASIQIPTPAQAEAGNYRKDHLRIHGLDIAIETRKGKSRKPGWPKMACHYGYIKRTEGADGDHVDVMIGPHTDSELVVVVDQVNHKGKFDEHKCLIGFRTKQDAIDTYRRCYTPGWKVGPTTAMTIDQFKAWLNKGNQTEPIEKQVSQYAAKSSGNQARWITTETGSHVLIGRDGTVKAGMGGKFNGKKLGATKSDQPPKGNRPSVIPKKTMKHPGGGIGIDLEGRLPLQQSQPQKQLVDSSRQVAKKSPVVQDFASSTMARIKAAEQAGPDVDQPSVKDHPLHHSQLSSAMQHALLEINGRLYGIVGKVGAAASIAANAGADADQQREAKRRAWTGYEQETQHSPEIARVRAQLNLPKSINRVEGVDQSQIKSALSDLTKLIANAASSGTNLKPYVRFNNIIPRELAPKLKPNDKLIRPVKDHERFAALVQQFAATMSAASVERHGTTADVDTFLEALTEQYAARKLKSQPGQQEFQWITVHPPGHEHGQPVLINKKDGTIQAGMGGNFNGQKISDLGKSKEPQAKHASDKAATSEETLAKHGFYRNFRGLHQWTSTAGRNWMTSNSKESALEQANIYFQKTPEADRKTSEERAKDADDALIERMHARYGKLSIPELEAEHAELKAAAQVRSNREFTGTGTRRTSAAVTNEGARNAGQEALELGIYIRSKKEKEESANSEKKPSLAERNETVKRNGETKR